ncbi:hypothetical protein LTS18_004834 [Coniosporium uncinatum]|uniref:Uncharacterized protein n=1 Tax=Coniosporium uncinatum TaxID=93489 RepID=A0ACC3DRS5_9PEZI|nr:hypothetical protein LTS18_004834 [Coniosporium uncinatum]
MPFDADHQDLVRYTDASKQGFFTLCAKVADAARPFLSSPLTTSPHTFNTVHIASSPPPPSTSEPREDPYKLLIKYDTVFLVDDSGSMKKDARWAKAEKTLAACAERAVRYDPDGVDIHFLNSKDKNHNNRQTHQQVMDLFQLVATDGNPTPIGDALDAELTAYLSKFRADQDIKGLNLIILTDGAADDADLVEEAIVLAATELKDLGVRKARRQIAGYKFVQIGDDPEATKFLKRLDDDIRGSRSLNRDVRCPMSDMTIFSTIADLV